MIEADPALRTFSLNVLDELEGWVKALAARSAAGFHSAPIVAAANALRDGVDPDAETLKPRTPSVEATAVLPPPARRPSPEDDFEPAPDEQEAGDTEILDDFVSTASGALDEAPAAAAAADPAPAFVLDLPADVPAHADQGHARTELMEERTVVQPMAQAPEYAAPNFEFDLGELDKPASPGDAAHADEQRDAGPDTVPAELDEASFDLLPTQRTAEPAANDAAVAPATGTRAFDTLTVGDQLPADDAENYKVIGPLRIGLGLFNIFLNLSMNACK